MPVDEIGSKWKQQTLSAGKAVPSNTGSLTGEWRQGMSSALIMGDITHSLQAVGRSTLVTYWKQQLYVIPHNSMVVSTDKQYTIAFWLVGGTPLSSR